MSNPFAGVDHVGYVVSDLDAAIQFAVEVLGFDLITERAGRLEDAEGDTLSRRLGVPARATGNFRFVRAGEVPIEFLQWTAPDQNPAVACNSDIAGRHLAIKVSDMSAALERISAFAGAEIREPNERGYIYVKTPFGLEVQLIPVSGAS
jgi:catechol 2,3-dioxygenase-like lactoylglutathione lyase family enzyme